DRPPLRTARRPRRRTPAPGRRRRAPSRPAQSAGPAREGRTERNVCRRASRGSYGRIRLHGERGRRWHTVELQRRPTRCPTMSARRLPLIALVGYVLLVVYQSLVSGGAWQCGGTVLGTSVRLSRTD